MSIKLIPGAFATADGAVILGGGGGGGGGAPTGPAGGDLNGTYPNPGVDDGADGTAIHDNEAGEISAIAAKATPTTSDFLLIEDAADSNNKKSITIGNLPFGSGDVVGPASATDDSIVAFDGTTGKLVKDGSITATAVSGHVASTANPHGTDLGNIGSGTLAELNAAVTDATLDDSSDPRTPTSHASSHEDGGSDEITIENLATGATDTSFVLNPDGAGGVSWGAPSGGGGGTALDANATSENLTCARTNQSPTVDVSKPGQVNLGSESAASHGTSADYAAILSGLNNLVDGTYSCVVSGQNNDIDRTSTGAILSSCVLGGENNKIQNTSSSSIYYATIAGGSSNQIRSLASVPVWFCGIGSGSGNRIGASGGTSTGDCWYNYIGGGDGNLIEIAFNGRGDVQHCVIGGGDGNLIQMSGSSTAADVLNCGVFSGSDNEVKNIATSGIDLRDSAVLSGRQNRVYCQSTAVAGSVVVGGLQNYISLAAGSYNVILGGSAGRISAGEYSVVLGGDNCSSSSNYSISFGHQSGADLDGTMVFSDDRAQDCDAVTTRQAVFGYENGVRIVETTEEDGAVTLVRELQTTDSADNAIWNETLDDNSAMLVTARVVGMESDGSDRNAYILNALVYRDGGGATIQGSVDVQLSVESDAAWGATISVTSNDVQVTVNGNGDTVNWRVTIQKQRVG